jgi:hypothetical protein
MNRQHLGAITAVLSGVLLAACASHEPKKTEPAKAAASKPIGPQTAGYTTLINNAGEPVYCVKKTPTGSNVARTTICMTAKEWERARENDQQTLNDIRKDYNPPKF